MHRVEERKVEIEEEMGRRVEVVVGEERDEERESRG